MSRREKLRSELPIPAAARRDTNAVEALRVWFNARGPHCSVRPGVWEESFGVDEPTGWAVLIADNLRELASGIASGAPGSLIEAASRILFSRLDQMIAGESTPGPTGPSSPPGKRELPIPRVARRDREAFEMMRVWVAGGNRHASAKLGSLYQGSVAHAASFMGVFFAEVARQVAQSLAGRSEEGVKGFLRSMSRVIHAELGRWAGDVSTGSGERHQGPGRPVVGATPQPVISPAGGGMACTPLGAFLERVRAVVPEPHHTGRAFYRAWAETIPPGIPVGEGPGDEFSVTRCDGEWCISLPHLIRYLRRGEEEAGDRSAMDCYRELVRVLEGLEAMARDGLIPR